MGERSIWTVFSVGLQDGFLAVTTDFSRLQQHLVWLGHTGAPTGARHEPAEEIPNELLATLPDGRAILVSGQESPSGSSAALEEYGSDGGLQWSTPMPGSRGFPLFAAVDVSGNTLLEQFEGDGGVSLTWIDEAGVVGASFGMRGPIIIMFQRAEGGFFLSSSAQWVGQVSSGGHAIEPPPDWLPTPPFTSTRTSFMVTPGRDGYVIDRRFTVPTSSTLEVRSAAGEVCGEVQLFPLGSPPLVSPRTVALGADGTPILSGLSCLSSGVVSPALQVNAGVPVCSCAWQYWPALLR
jgi:hypothetical protein